MPEISRFFGIVIAIYWKDHGIPHFHAKYGGYRASFSIGDLRLLERVPGSLCCVGIRALRSIPVDAASVPQDKLENDSLYRAPSLE